MDSSDSESDDASIPPADPDAPAPSETNLLPELSRKQYEAVYKSFMDWQCANKKVAPFSEPVMLEYFDELSTKYKSSSLWNKFSMLRSTLNLHHGVGIETYPRLRRLLKSKTKGYQSKTKKSKTFTPEQVDTFLTRAPDNPYLATKVALIMGVMGSCRVRELHAMTTNDVQDVGTVLLVTVSNARTSKVRRFTVTGRFHAICKQYIDLRPDRPAPDSFFLNYQKGRCTTQNMGVNKLGAMGKQVAKFLNLPNPEMYTGHSFRKSSATLLVEAGGDMGGLSGHGDWKFSSVSDGFLDVSMKNPLSSTNSGTDSVCDDYSDVSIKNEVEEPESDVKVPPNTVYTQNLTANEVCSTFPIRFENCSNITINFIVQSDTTKK